VHDIEIVPFERYLLLITVVAEVSFARTGVVVLEKTQALKIPSHRSAPP